jgi:hypothetical protein
MIYDKWAPCSDRSAASHREYAESGETSSRSVRADGDNVHFSVFPLISIFEPVPIVKLERAFSWPAPACVGRHAHARAIAMAIRNSLFLVILLCFIPQKGDMAAAL